MNHGSPSSIASIIDFDGQRIGLYVKHEPEGNFSIQTVEGFDIQEGFRYASEREAKDDIDRLYHSKEWDLQWEI